MINLALLIPKAVVQGVPLLYGSTGEILTEKSGNLNLGIPGVMYVGAISGVIGAFVYEQTKYAVGTTILNFFFNLKKITYLLFDEFKVTKKKD